MRGDVPRARIDDFHLARQRKLAETRDLVRQHNCQAVLYGGDLGHRPDLAESVTAELIAELRQFTAPVIGVWGNTHDIWGDNPATIHRTTLHVIRAAGLIRLLEPGEAVMLEGAGFAVQVTGQGYHQDMDRRYRALDYCVAPNEEAVRWEENWLHWRRPETRWAIHIVHGMLRTAPLHPDVPVTLVDDVATKTAADITLTGHDHNGFGIRKLGTKTFCNPGALMRLTAAREEIARPVQVALITLTADNYTVELIPLQSAAPGPTVLDRSHIDRAAEREHALEEFLTGVQAGGSFEVLDPVEIVQRIAVNKGVSEQVRSTALAYVQRAQEAEAAGRLVEEVA